MCSLPPNHPPPHRPRLIDRLLIDPPPIDPMGHPCSDPPR